MAIELVRGGGFRHVQGVLATKSFLGCLRIVCFGLLVSSAIGAEGFSFWVWHRRDPLSGAERQQLGEMGASLLWHVGELDISSGAAAGDR